MSGERITLQEAFERAVAHEQEGRLEDAERLLELILATVPEQPDALHELGIVAARRKNFVEAARLIERAIAGRKDSSLHYRNICEIYRRLGRLEEAIAAGKRAVELNPKDPHCRVNLAIIYYASCEFEKSAECCEEALALAPKLPGAHFELAEALLVRGEFERGWEEYEWRFQIAGAKQPMPKTDRPLWDGKPVDGHLLLVADQGFGDVIQFARFLPWV
jgi:tetratricopeptide (TPR) repeat protein